MAVLWSCSEVRADSFQNNWKSRLNEGKGETMQHGVVVLGTKGRVEHIGASDLVRMGLRLAPPFFLYHSLCFLIPECFRDRPEYKSLVLRLTEVEHGWQYGD
jgi:hypothetical protein